MFTVYTDMLRVGVCSYRIIDLNHLHTSVTNKHMHKSSSELEAKGLHETCMIEFVLYTDYTFCEKVSYRFRFHWFILHLLLTINIFT